MRTWDEVNELLQAAQENLENAVRTAGNPFLPDFRLWRAEFIRAGSVAVHREQAMKHLREANIDSYAALEDRYHQVTEMASLRDMEEIRRRFDMQKHSNPMWRGLARPILNVMDFLVAIPHIQQPPDPAVPTTLGMFLSAVQQVVTNECLYIKAASDNLFLHPSLIMGNLLAINSRTTDGGWVSDLYTWDTPETGGTTPTSRPFTLEQFRIRNAVCFDADRLLLSGELRVIDEETEEVRLESMNVHYDPFDRDRGIFLVSGGMQQMKQLDNIRDPRFMQELMSRVILGR